MSDTNPNHLQARPDVVDTPPPYVRGAPIPPGYVLDPEREGYLPIPHEKPQIIDADAAMRRKEDAKAAQDMAQTTKELGVAIPDAPLNGSLLDQKAASPSAVQWDRALARDPQLDDLLEVDRQFTYHTPTTEQVQRMALLRAEAKNLAKSIILHVPRCPDRSAAIRLLREAIMTANAAIIIPRT